jgi:small subunit ribosomal protein S21
LRVCIEGGKLTQVIVRDGESLENAIRRLKRATSRDGIMLELKKREYFEKPSIKKKKKSENARKKLRLGGY